MEPSDWIALAALALSAIAIVVAPLIAARIERQRRIRDERREAYAETLHVLGARLAEIEWRSLGVRDFDGGSSKVASEQAVARPTLHDSRAVREAVREFLAVYAMARPRLPGVDPHLGQIRDELETLFNSAANAMRSDLGVDPLAVPPNR